MAILGLQGVRGGVGTTSVTAALAWSLQLLGESVLVIDACADNLLRMSFNVDFTREEGWARALYLPARFAAVWSTHHHGTRE